MKDNYKAENLKLYIPKEEDKIKFQERAFELGYEWCIRGGKKIKCLDKNRFYLSRDGTINCPLGPKYFIKSLHKQITLDEFLAPQKGEKVWVIRDNWSSIGKEFYMDLGEDAPNGLRYMTADGELWSELRPIQKPELPNKEGFEEVINHLKEAIKLLER